MWVLNSTELEEQVWPRDYTGTYITYTGTFKLCTGIYILCTDKIDKYIKHTGIYVLYIGRNLIYTET